MGGNQGDRRRALAAALRALARLPGTEILARSRVYETAPVGPSARPYLNMALKARTALSAMGLLIEAKRLEAAAGRRPGGPRWGARPLDVDLVDYAGRRLRTRWLTLPHPRAAARAFVLAPLREIAPGFRPDGRRPVRELLRRLKPDPRTVRIYSSHGR